MGIGVEAMDLFFAYDEGPTLFNGLNFNARKGARVLLLGANGVGKSTLLRLLAGKHLVKRGQVRVLGSDPFRALWTPREVSLVSGNFPLSLDLSVAELIEVAKRRPEFGGHKLLAELLDLLEVDLKWRMHRVSTGQRRRVDLLLSLVNDPKVLLLDEVTSDLDIVGRQDLLAWLKKRSEEKGMTIFLATHILDGLSPWATQILLLGPQETLFQGSSRSRRIGKSLFDFVLRLLRRHRLRGRAQGGF